MSSPRLIAPGTTYLLTRRCFARMFLLRPSPEVNQIFQFCVAHAADVAGIQVHAYSVLSNHYHIVATDTHGNLPVFMHWLNEYVAKCINSLVGRWESFWAPGSYSAVALNDEGAIVDRLVYTYTNPVSAGLVRTYTDWPGAHSLPDQIGGDPLVVPRPNGFFRQDGPVPEKALLRLVPPPGFPGDHAQWPEQLTDRIRLREREIVSEFERKGRAFLGPRRVLRQSPLSRPATAEPRRGLNPRVAARDKWRRVESLQRLKGFLDAYRAAWRAFCAGDQTVVFPFGTYAMRIRFGVCCNGP